MEAARAIKSVCRSLGESGLVGVLGIGSFL